MHNTLKGCNHLHPNAHIAHGSIPNTGSCPPKIYRVKIRSIFHGGDIGPNRYF